MGLSGRLLGLSWPLLGPSWPLLGLSWRHLGRSWASLGRSWAAPGPSWPALGASWASLGASWAALGSQQRVLAKSCSRCSGSTIFKVPGAQVGPKLAPSGPKLAHVGPSCPHLGLKPNPIEKTRRFLHPKPNPIEKTQGFVGLKLARNLIRSRKHNVFGPPSPVTKTAGGRRGEPAGGDLGEFTFGKRWVIASVVASATTGHLQIASLHGLSEP